MKQMTFADAEYAGMRKLTRKELFLIEMDRVVPWKGLIALIEPHYPKGEGGRPAYPLMAMLRVIPVSRSVPSMQAVKWFGRWQPGAAPTKSWARAARCTKPDARSRKPMLRYGPRHPFGYVKTRFRGLAKNTAQLVTLFALSNLWMARRHLLTNAGEVRL